MLLIVGSVLASGRLDRNPLVDSAPLMILDDPVRWGGEGIVLTAGDDWASIELGCARASIPHGLKPIHDGVFNVPGTFIQNTAIRTNEEPKPLPIRAEGKICGTHMTLKIVNNETGDVIGSYTLERGKSVQLARCL